MTAPVAVASPLRVDHDGSIQINTSALRPPANLYDADFAWVKMRNGIVSLFFAKASYDDPKRLRTRLEIRFAIEPFYHHFWMSARDFQVRVRKYVERTWPTKLEREMDPSQLPADKDHSDWANVDYCAHSGSQASLDFYNLSTAGLAKFANDKGSAALDIAPVVRVQTTTLELWRLFEDAGTLIEKEGLAAIADAGAKPQAKAEETEDLDK